MHLPGYNANRRQTIAGGCSQLCSHAYCGLLISGARSGIDRNHVITNKFVDCVLFRHSFYTSLKNSFYQSFYTSLKNSFYQSFYHFFIILHSCHSMIQFKSLHTILSISVHMFGCINEGAVRMAVSENVECVEGRRFCASLFILQDVLYLSTHHLTRTGINLG